MSSVPHDRRYGRLPAGRPGVDERLVMPETRYEVVDGEVVYVSPADPPHASRHSKLSALLEAYVADGYDAASDMLTRTSDKGDMAPDGSVYPTATDPVTGGRQLEELAFAVVSTETLGAAATKAARLAERGVRRVFAIDVGRRRLFEWSSASNGWEMLAADASIEDPALAVGLAVRDLVEAAKTDDAVARALLAKRNGVLQAALAAQRAEGEATGRLHGKAEAVLAVLRSRGLVVHERYEQRILAMDDAATLDRWIAAAAKCRDVASLLST